MIFFDALRVKIRDEGAVKSKAIYLALGVTPDGHKDVLGLWIEQTEGAKFWLRVMTELQARGVQDVLFAVVDGLQGFPEAITAVFPQATIQTCIVHLLRHSLELRDLEGPQGGRGRPQGDLPGARAPPRPSATLASLCRRAVGAEVPADRARPGGGSGPQVIPFFAFPLEVRRILYTTNAIESLHMQLRKALKTRGHFPSDEAALKLLYLVLRNITRRWQPRPAGVEGGHDPVRDPLP